MRKERKETVLSETGKFLIDIAKLVFGGVILAGIMKYENINPWLLFSIGGIFFTHLLFDWIIIDSFIQKKGELKWD